MVCIIPLSEFFGDFVAVRLSGDDAVGVVMRILGCSMSTCRHRLCGLDALRRLNCRDLPIFFDVEFPSQASGSR